MHIYLHIFAFILCICYAQCRLLDMVALSPKLREALTDYHHAEAKYGSESREAQIAHEYFLDVSSAENMKQHPTYVREDDHMLNYKEKDDLHALDYAHVIEELNEISHMEKSILDRLGTTDFEIGEGFLERGIGREDQETFGLWDTGLFP